jgi:hypothetical protein
MTVKELREAARKCRIRARTKTGEAYHREMQRAQGLEAQAKEREAWLNSNSKEEPAHASF